jgi:hypothetical protein
MSRRAFWVSACIERQQRIVWTRWLLEELRREWDNC